MAETTTWKERIQEWVARGPLRQWRQSEHLSIRDVAGLLGVNTYTLQSWEQGAAFPTPESQLRLIEQTRVPDLLARWEEWQDERPSR